MLQLPLDPNEPIYEDEGEGEGEDEDEGEANSNDFISPLMAAVICYSFINRE